MIHGQEERTYQRGDLIFHENERPDGVYIVRDGLVELFRVVTKDGTAQDIQLEKVGARGMFGEMGLIDSHMRSASARALGPTTVIFIPKEMFQQHLQQLPPWVGILIKTFVHRLRESNKRLIDALEKGSNAPSVHLIPHDVTIGGEQDDAGGKILDEIDRAG